MHILCDGQERVVNVHVHPVASLLEPDAEAPTGPAHGRGRKGRRLREATAAAVDVQGRGLSRADLEEVDVASAAGSSDSADGIHGAEGMGGHGGAERGEPRTVKRGFSRAHAHKPAPSRVDWTPAG